MKTKMLKIIAISIFFAQLNLILAGVIIPEPGLTIVNDGNTVVLSWQTTQQDDLKNFVIQRKALNGTYVDIATIYPEDDMDYVYIDRNVYKTESSVYSYKLLIVEKDGRVSSLESYVRVSDSNISSVRKTWGSIKALFR